MKEEMRPVIRLRQNSLMILMFFLDQVDLQNLQDLLDRQDRLAHHQDGLQLHHLLVTEKEWVHERASRERLPLRPSPPEPQLIPIPLKNDNNNHPPLEQRQRRRSRSRERVYPHAQVPAWNLLKHSAYCTSTSL